ncbi:phage protein [Streptococcus pyogenes]|nr:phage protein [Streptococcus pyogenes]
MRKKSEKITQEIDEGYDKKGMDLLLKANL